MLSSDKKPAGRKGSDQDEPVLILARLSFCGERKNREEAIIVP
jgi:hypothetical protein